MNPNETGTLPKIKVRKLKKPPYVIDHSKLQRFHKRDTIFARVMWDYSWRGYQRRYDEKVPEMIRKGKLGHSRIDFALAYASWIVHDAFEGGFSWRKIELCRGPVDTIGIDLTKTRYEVSDPERMSMYVKRAAEFFGASLVGICKLDRNWLYAEDDVPEKFENVIVMAIAVSYTHLTLPTN